MKVLVWDRQVCKGWASFHFLFSLIVIVNNYYTTVIIMLMNMMKMKIIALGTYVKYKMRCQYFYSNLLDTFLVQVLSFSVVII